MGDTLRTAVSERMQQLHEMLESQPSDPFLLYAIAMEYKKIGDGPSAITNLDRVIVIDPGYCYAYYQKGQILEDLGHVNQAAAAYKAGVQAATKKPDPHALAELKTALAGLVG